MNMIDVADKTVVQVLLEFRVRLSFLFVAEWKIQNWNYKARWGTFHPNENNSGGGKLNNKHIKIKNKLFEMSW